MQLTDWANIATAVAAIATTIAVVVAVLALRTTVKQFNQNQTQQQAAQTREDLQAIIGDCMQFLRPLSQNIPYPVLHTVTAIIQQFRERIDKLPKKKHLKAVEDLLADKDILLSICVEGWVNSSQISHMIDMAEELEHKAFSHNLQGRLLFICHACFLLAGIVAEICSPESFFNMLTSKHDELVKELEECSSQKDKAMDTLDTVAVLLQRHICQEFTASYQKAISESLYIIQTAAVIFVDLTDEKLMQLAKAREEAGFSQVKTSNIMEAHNLCNSLKKVKSVFEELEKDKNVQSNTNLQDLRNLVCSKEIEKVVNKASIN